MGESENKPEDLEQAKEDQAMPEYFDEDKPAKKINIFAIAAGISALAAFVLLVVLGRCELHWAGLRFAFVFFWVFAGVSGIVAIVDITLERKRLKGYSLAILAIIVFFSPWLVPQIFWSPPDTSNRVCRHTLHQLSVAIKQYVDAHDGHLPAADKWCDLLLEQDKKLSRNYFFKCPSVKGGICGYAFNKNLDGLHLYRDVRKHSEVVLVFEADGGWNLSGGQELLKMRHRGMKGKSCNLLFADFSVMRYDKERFEKEPLRWKP